MARNIHAHAREKRRVEPGKVMAGDLAVMMLRTGTIIVVAICVFMLSVTASGAIRGTQARAAASLWTPLACAAGSIAALVVGWRAWKLRRWACAATAAFALLFCLGEPWRPGHFADGQFDPVSALAASVMLLIFVFAPIAAGLLLGRTRLHSGF